MKKLIPNFLRPTLSRMYYLFVDSVDTLKGKDKRTPPRSMIFVGSGDYIEIGNEFKNYFINLGGLKPHHRVLDVGCGIGRMAVPLTNYLTSEGGYWGFDIVKKGIAWCQKEITREFNHFHFQHVDIYNKYYNKQGTVAASQFVFPFEAAFFDFVFLTSVFTHMLPGELENYLKEISRVLKPGGNALITFFLLNSESKQLIEMNKSKLDFKHKITDQCKTTNSKIPEDAIAYEEEFVLSLLNKYQLTIDRPIYYGSWCGRESYLTFQDLIIMKK
jgi:SAM-dependent methyltransferase